jgi:hypothetical protein
MIKLLTFKTNHSIMGDLTETSSMFIISKPVQVVMQPTKDGASMGFVPFVQFCDEWKTGIVIKKDDVLFESTPVIELINQYNDMFGSGIQIATSIPKL